MSDWSRAAIQNIPHLSDDERATLRELLDQLDAKRPRNILRASWYDGKHAVKDLGISTPPSMQQVAYVLGWPAKAVDLLNRRCRLEGFTSADTDLDRLGLASVLDDNRFLTESSQGQSSGLVHAVSWLVTTRGNADAGEPPVVLMFRDALDATALWSKRTRRIVAFLSVLERGENDREPVDMVMYLPGLTWTITRSSATGAWSAESAQTSLDYVPVEPIVFRPRLGRPFGESRISRPVMSLTQQAIRSMRRAETNAEFYALVQRYVEGADLEMFKDASGNPIPRWKILLGGVWALPMTQNEDGSATKPTMGQFQQASQQPHMDQLRMLAEQFAGETSVPTTSLGMTTAANPASADAYLASREDLITEAEGATDEWGGAYARSMQTALRYLGEANPPRIAATWRSPRFESRAAAADAGQKSLAAVPWLAETEVGLELLGLDRPQIDRAMAEKRRAQARATLASLVGSDAKSG